MLTLDTYEQAIREYMREMPKDMDGLETRAQGLENALEVLKGNKTKEVRMMVQAIEKLKRETMREIVRVYLTKLSEQKASRY
jgi:hypothetical protein